MALKARGGVWYLVKKINGRRFRITTGFPVATKAAKESAKRRATEIELEIRSGVHGWSKDVPTVKDYWTKTYRPTYTVKKSAPGRDDQVMIHALKFFGDKQLDEVKKSDCERYLNVRRKSVSANPKHKRPKPIAEGTVQRERSFLHALFQQAVEDELIDRNPWRKIERGAYVARHRVLTPENQGELLRRLSARFQRFVLFLLGTGVRLEECRGVDPAKDLHLKERWVRVTGKFGKTREVPLPSELVPVIEEQLKADGKLWTQNPQRLREVLADVCKGRSAVQGRMSRRGRIVAAMPARTALPHLSPHDLRHTYGHRWLVGRGDIYTLSKILGHASVKVTEEHYAYLLKEDIRAKADLVDLGLGLPAVRGKLIAMRNR